MLKGKWCLVLTDIMSVIGYITQTIYIFYWKLYIIYISYAYARINNEIIRTKLAIVKVLYKLLRAHFSTHLQPFRAFPPRPRTGQNGEGAAVRPYNRHLDHHRGRGGAPPLPSFNIRIRCCFLAYYAPRGTIFNIIFFLCVIK